MGRRIALVVSADSGAELTGGRRDAMRVFSLLTDEELGCCDPSSPTPVIDCRTRAEFHLAWDALMSSWQHQDQLLFYFSGHGVMKNGKFTLALGAAPAQQYLPIDHLAADLQAHCVRRAVLVLDACHSGAAFRSGAKDGAVETPKLEQALPDGIVVLASCRESERSFEFEELLSQQLPFTGETLPAVAMSVASAEIVPLRQLVPTIPSELERICLKALQRDLSRRYGSAREMALEIRSYLPTNGRYNSLGQDRAMLWHEIKSLL